MTAQAIPHLVDSPEGWDRPLGTNLPPFGPQNIRVLPIVGLVVLAVGLLSLCGWLAYLWFRPVLGVQFGPEHDSLKHAALAWRKLYAADQGVARSLEIWQLEAEDAQAPQFLLVAAKQDPKKNAPAELLDDQIKLYQEPARRLEPSLRQLSNSQQTVQLGEEKLSRGALLVALKAKETLLFASADSPAAGYVHKSEVGLALYDQCLPVVGEELQGASFATPMNPSTGGDTKEVYWLARKQGNVTTLLSKTCGSGVLEPHGAKSLDIPIQSYPLLTLYHKAPAEAYVLVVQPEGSSVAHELFKYRGMNSQSLERVFSFTAARVHDSFQDGVDSAGEQLKVPVRKVSEAGVEYLIQDAGDSWVFAGCAAPNLSQYLVANVSCDLEDEQLGQKLASSLQELGAEDVKSCIPSEDPKFPGCVISGFHDSTCNVRLIHEPCASVKDKK